MGKSLKQNNAENAIKLPANYEGVANLISERYEGLSDGYQLVARFMMQNPNSVALESVNSLAAMCKSHPSALVRFAQQLGYSGFKELQAVFQTRLATAAPGFRERVSALDAELSRNTASGSLGILRSTVVRDIAALQGLLEQISEEDLSKAAELCASAKTIFVAGQLRSEPIAELIRYLMTMVQRKVILMNSAGGLSQEIAMTMEPGDILIAVAFRHYAKEVVAIADHAVSVKIPVVVITDTQLSPLAKGAAALFTIPEDEYTFSRSLAAPMSLVQTLATATAAKLRPKGDQDLRIPTVTEIAKNSSVRFRSSATSPSRKGRVGAK